MRYLRHTKNGTIHQYTDILAKRNDMVECDANGTLTVQPIAPVVLPAQPAAPPATDATRPVGVSETDFPETEFRRPPRVGAEVVTLAPEDENAPKLSDQELQTKKQELVAFARDRFKVNLNPEDSLAILQKRVDKLVAKARSKSG